MTANPTCTAHITPNVSQDVGPTLTTAPGAQATLFDWQRCRLNSAYWTVEEARTFTPSVVIASPTSFPVPQQLFLTQLGYQGGSTGFTFKYGSTTQGWLSWVTPQWTYGMNNVYELPLTYTSNFSTLTVACSGVGNGTVVSDDDIINATCTAGALAGVSTDAMLNGTQVTLTATAIAGSVFTGFSDGGCSTSPCTVTLNSDTTVTATFGPYTPSEVHKGAIITKGTTVVR
jgi:hypothetical protein